MKAVIAILVWSAVARADSWLPDDPPPIDLAARAGIHHTHMTKFDDNFTASGPRVELEAALHAVTWLSIAGIGAWSHYSVDNVGGSIDGPLHDVHDTDLWLGARVLVHPHPRVFFGATLWNQWESYDGWPHKWTYDVVAGVDIARLDRFVLHVSAAYTRDHGYYEYLDVFAVMIGARWCGDHCRW